MHSAGVFPGRGCARKFRRSTEMSSFGKRMCISLAAQEQEACHDGAPDAKKPAQTALHFRAPGARRGHVCYLVHGLGGLDVGFFLHKNKVLHSNVAGVLVNRPKKTDTTGQLCSSEAFFSSTLPSCALSQSRRCLQRPASHVQGVVSLYRQKKKVLVHGLMQRAPRLVGSSCFKERFKRLLAMNMSDLSFTD